MSRTSDLIERINRHSANHYKRFDGVVFRQAFGTQVWDVEGKEFLDMLATYSAVSLGNNPPRIVEIFSRNLPMVARAYYNEQEAPYYEALCGITGLDKVVPMNTGAEAVETAIKLARKWGYTRKGIERNKAQIIVADGNFHGRTTTIVSFSTEEPYKQWFGPYAPKVAFPHVPFGDASAIERAITDRTAAVFIEPIQGEGGIYVPPDGYLREVRDICKRHNVLFMLDEIQTGFGRTGKMFAFEHEDARPDVLVLGKALGGGMYPVSAVVTTEDAMVFEPGEHGSTFGGNAIACAIGLETIQLYEYKGLVEHAAEMGRYLTGELLGITHNSALIQEVRGRGLLVGIELTKKGGKADAWCEELLARRIICKGAHDKVIRLAPPLIITRQQLDLFLKEFNAVLREHKDAV